MGIRCFYPENLAAALSGNSRNTKFIDHAKYEGYSENICSYALLFAGGSEQVSKYRRVHDPDLLLVTNNQCGTLLYWWEVLQEKYGLPLQFINYPRYEGEILPAEKKYIIDQYMSLIAMAETKFGKKLYDEKLDSTVENAMKATSVWEDIQLFRKTNYIPPRIMAESLVPIVLMKGHSKTVEYYEELLAELKSDYSGRTVEKRLLWLGYPFWFLRGKYPYIHESAGIVMDIYTTQWLLDYSGESSMEKLANAYSKIYINMSLDRKIKYIERTISEYEIDGVIIHLNKSCKRDSTSLVLVNQYIKENLNIPAVVIESDMANPDWYNSESINLNIDAFLELL
jgi:benzoyl-CoA reductase/2-hydroxyglutaryl-CoA dehydratase subunit BcrC/BadD/HgdB